MYRGAPPASTKYHVREPSRGWSLEDVRGTGSSSARFALNENQSLHSLAQDPNLLPVLSASSRRPSDLVRLEEPRDTSPGPFADAKAAVNTRMVQASEPAAAAVNGGAIQSNGGAADPAMSGAIVPVGKAKSALPGPNLSGVKQVVDTQTKAIGLIQPPPDIRAIVDKTAQFVAKNGEAAPQLTFRPSTKVMKVPLKIHTDALLRCRSQL